MNLAYRGVRARDTGFNLAPERDFNEIFALVQVKLLAIARMFMNLSGNGFPAANKATPKDKRFDRAPASPRHGSARPDHRSRYSAASDGPVEPNHDVERKAARLGSLWASPKRAKHEPNVRPIPLVSTLDLGETVEIRVRDNGTGIPEDIVAKAHVGTITVTCPSLDTTVSGDVLGFGSVASARFKALGDRPRSRDRRQAWPENAGTGRKRSKEDAMRHLSHGRMNAGLSAWPGANSDDL